MLPDPLLGLRVSQTGQPLPKPQKAEDGTRKPSALFYMKILLDRRGDPMGRVLPAAPRGGQFAE